MATTRMTLNEVLAEPSKMDHSKVKATTEADIRRQMIEDGEDPDLSLRRRAVNLAPQRRRGQTKPQKQLPATSKSLAKTNQHFSEGIRQMETGNFNTFFGKVKDGRYGDGNVVIGATDDKGNTIIDRPMVVGFGASGSQGDIVFGAFAGGRSAADLALMQFFTVLMAEQTLSPADKKNLESQTLYLAQQTSVPANQRNNSVIRSVLDSVKTGAQTISSVAAAWNSVEPLFHRMFGF